MKLYPLQKKAIIKSNEIFKDVIQNGFSEKGCFITLFFKKDQETSVGFAVNKKCRTKPIRNRIKRQLRELWRTRKIYGIPKAKYILMGSHKMKSTRFEILSEELDDLLERVIQKYS